MSDFATAFVPARIHHTILDSTGCSLNSPGGGGICFSVSDVGTTCRLAFAPDLSIHFLGPASAAAEFILRSLSSEIGAACGYHIELSPHPHSHKGLGSSAGILLSCALAANELHGAPLTPGAVRRFVSSHFVEDDASRTLTVKGFETGCAEVAGLYGGLSVVGADMEIIDRMDLPSDYKVAVFTPHSYTNALATDIPSTSGGGEQTVLAYNNELDSLFRGAKAYKVLWQLIPSMRRKDEAAIGRVLYELNYLPTPLGSLTRRHSAVYYKHFEALRLLGADIAGLSSAGPSFYATSRDLCTLERCCAYVVDEYANNIDTLVSHAGGGARVEYKGHSRMFEAVGLHTA